MDFKKIISLFKKTEREPNKKLDYRTFGIKEESLLLKISKIVVSNLNLDKIYQDATDVFVKYMDYPGAVLFLVNKAGRTIDAHTFSGTVVNKLLSATLPMSFKEFRYSFDLDNNLLVKTYLTKSEIEDEDGMVNFTKPLVPSALMRFINKVSGTKRTRSFPVIFGDEVIAVLMIDSRKNIFKEEEKEMLRIFCIMIGVAIHNSELYSKINSQVFHLQKKTQDLESLLALGNMSLLGIEVEKSVQNIMDILPVKLGHLGVLGAVLTRYDEKDGKVYAYITTESALVQKAKKLLPKSSLGDYYVLVNKTEPLKYNLTTKSILNNEITKSDNLVDFISPPVDARTAWLIKKMMSAKATIAIPINIRGAKLGAVIYIFSKPLADINRRELDIITAFAQHVGVVLENLQFYESLNENIAELTKTKNNLEEAISIKNDFLHIVSHQLRTPLAAVRGFVYMWRDGDFDNLASGKLKEIRIRVADNIDRLNNIVNDMIIAMESQGSMKLIFAPTNIETLLKENIEILKSGFEKKGLYIKYQKISKDIPLIEADGKYLRHVFMNLIDNAVKYTERGGLEIMLRREEDTICVRFVDTGVGISDTDKALLFKKFSRGKNSAHINPGGSGLGLFISKQILDEHHGTLQMSSMGEGKGSTFVVELPVRQPVLPEPFSGGKAN